MTDSPDMFHKEICPPDCTHTCGIFRDHSPVDPDSLDVTVRDGEIAIHIGAHVNWIKSECAVIIMGPQDAATFAYGMLQHVLAALEPLCETPRDYAALMDTMMAQAYQHFHAQVYGKDHP